MRIYTNPNILSQSASGSQTSVVTRKTNKTRLEAELDKREARRYEDHKMVRLQRNLIIGSVLFVVGLIVLLSVF